MNALGFDDTGAPVPITDFDFDSLDGEEQEATPPADTGQAWSAGFIDAIGLLTAKRRPGRAGCTAAGRDAAILAHLLLATGQTQEQLAKSIGASPAHVSAKVNHAKRTLAALAAGRKRLA